MNRDVNVLKSFSPLSVSEGFKEYYRRQRDASTPPPTTPFHVAALNGDLMRVQQLIEAQRVAVSAQDANGSTALHHAALLGRDRIAEVLIANGAGVGITSSDGNTPLHKAAQGGHVGIAKLLLGRGARADAMNVHGEYPIDVCAKRKHTEMTAFLRGYASGPT